MKTLTLVRHATANDKHESQQDGDRKLSERGQLQVQHIAKQLKRKNCLPDYLVCSPAQRTLQTATSLCQTLKLATHLIHVDSVLYSGSVKEILDHVRSLEIEYQHVFVVGHNPTITELAHYLCQATKKIVLPPAGVVNLKFAVKNWQALTTMPGELLFFLGSDDELR